MHDGFVRDGTGKIVGWFDGAWLRDVTGKLIARYDTSDNRTIERGIGVAGSWGMGIRDCGSSVKLKAPDKG